MTPDQQQALILRKYATGSDLTEIAAECRVGMNTICEVVGAVNFQRARAAELVRQHDAAGFNRHVLNGRVTSPHPASVQPRRNMRPVAVIRWEEPPPGRSNGGGKRESYLAPLADELRANPGRWALVHIGDSSGQATGMATHIARGQVLAFAPAGDFDAVSRRVDGRHRVYAVYLGEEG
jgi:hypothetical protein